jgi:molybdenum cofactor cytidylyltransferase
VTSLRHILRLGDHELVSLIGGGGKSTLLFALGNELAAGGGKVILTTTTKMGREQALAAPSICWSADMSCAVDALAGEGPVMLVTGGDDHKVTGPPPDVVDRLFTQSGADYVVVEADGSRGKPLKAPAAHEPVVPSMTTTVVALMGVDAIGKTLAEATHRIEQAVAFSGLVPRHVLTIADCAHILTHPNGLLRACPETARIVVGITKVGRAEHAVAAQLRDQLIDHPRVSDVVMFDPLLGSGAPR